MQQLKNLQQKAVDDKKIENAKVVVAEQRRIKEAVRKDGHVHRSFWHPDAEKPDPEKATSVEDKRLGNFIQQSMFHMDNLLKSRHVQQEVQTGFIIHTAEGDNTVAKINEVDRDDYEAVELTASCLHALVEKEELVDCGAVFTPEDITALKAAKFQLEFGPHTNYDDKVIEEMAGNLAASKVINEWSKKILDVHQILEMFEDYAYWNEEQHYIKADTEAKQKLRKEFMIQKNSKRGGKGTS